MTNKIDEMTKQPLIMTPNTYKILDYISIHPNQSQTQISKATNITYSQTHYIIKHLENKKLITSTKKKAKHINQITPQGKQVIKQIIHIKKVLNQ